MFEESSSCLTITPACVLRSAAGSAAAMLFSGILVQYSFQHINTYQQSADLRFLSALLAYSIINIAYAAVADGVLPSILRMECCKKKAKPSRYTPLESLSLRFLAEEHDLDRTGINSQESSPESVVAPEDNNYHQIDARRTSYCSLVALWCVPSIRIAVIVIMTALAWDTFTGQENSPVAWIGAEVNAELDALQKLGVTLIIAAKALVSLWLLRTLADALSPQVQAGCLEGSRTGIFSEIAVPDSSRPPSPRGRTDT